MAHLSLLLKVSVTSLVEFSSYAPETMLAKML